MSSLCSYVCSKPSLELRSGCPSSWSPCIFPCISVSTEHLGMSKHNLPKHPVWGWVRLGQSLSHQGPLFQDDDVIWPVLLKSFIPGLLCSEVHSTPGMLGKPFPQVTHPVFRFLHLQWNAFSEMIKNISVIFSNAAQYSVDIVYTNALIQIYTKQVPF